MSVFLFFLDGVGIGIDDPAINPFARDITPTLSAILYGYKLITECPSQINQSCAFKPIDASLGIDGLPQSATGQATILTGINVSREIGEHYGPKPTPEIIRILEDHSLMTHLRKEEYRVGFLNAYPKRYFEAIESGRRLPGAMAYAAILAGCKLPGRKELILGDAISADFTGAGWHTQLNDPAIPVIEPVQAGVNIARLASSYDFSIFEYWLPDIIGHRRNNETAEAILTTLDQVLKGLIQEWDMKSDLIIITSDHGNMEDLSQRRHTRNDVPLILLGNLAPVVELFDHAKNLTNIKDIVLTHLAAV